MFGLRVTYLTGRVYSSVFEDGDDKREAEWPPHPARLFAALVAAWGEGGAETDLLPVLEWLESRSQPPRVYYAPCSLRVPVRAYVPVNDSRGAGTLPEGRTRKSRVFPSASLVDPEAYFVWDDTLPEELRGPLDVLLRRTASVGHSSSLAAIEVTDGAPEGLVELQPDQRGTQRLRVAYPGWLGELRERFERFRRKPVKANRPGPGLRVRYGPRRVAGRPAPAHGLFREMICFSRSDGETLPLTATLQLVGAMRGALLRNAPQPCPEVISGHAPGSTIENSVPSERPHLALVPLPFVGSPHASGTIQGLAVLLPGTLAAGEREVCLATLEQVRELRTSGFVWRLRPASAEVWQYNLRPQAWCRPARTWATVTPFVFDQYPRDPYGSDAQARVRQALGRLGLPEPVSVAIMKTSPHVGAQPAPAFPAALPRPGKPRRFHHHVLVVFAESVAGPIVAGAGRYYGYGLFRPLGD